MSRQPNRPIFTLLMSTVMLGLYLAAGALPEPFIYDRNAILSGEVWRLVSGHLVHSDGGHLGWNLAGTLILGCLFERRNTPEFICATAVGMLTINLYLLSQPKLTHYVGYSGVLNTWLVLLLVRESTDPVLRPFVIATAIGVFLKLTLEWSSGAAIFTQTVWPSLPQAHLAGLIGGLLGWWLLLTPKSTFYTHKELRYEP